LSSPVGLLKLDKEHEQIVRYRNYPSDNESLASDNVISIYQDNEGNIWTCFQETEPNFLQKGRRHLRTLLISGAVWSTPLVTSTYEDHSGILWLGSMGGLNRIDRRSGKNIMPARFGRWQ
jgi:ligand-binding sensor domain-containing protein